MWKHRPWKSFGIPTNPTHIKFWWRKALSFRFSSSIFHKHPKKPQRLFRDFAFSFWIFRAQSTLIYVYRILWMKFNRKTKGSKNESSFLLTKTNLNEQPDSWYLYFVSNCSQIPTRGNITRVPFSLAFYFQINKIYNLSFLFKFSAFFQSEFYRNFNQIWYWINMILLNFSVPLFMELNKDVSMKKIVECLSFHRRNLDTRVSSTVGWLWPNPNIKYQK